MKLFLRAAVMAAALIGAAAPSVSAQQAGAEHAADVVLCVGHSGSLPKIIKAYGYPDPVEIGHDEYDSLFALVPRAGQAPSLLRLKY